MPPVIAQLSDLSERALLLLLLERQDRMATDLSVLQANVTNLTAAVDAIAPVLAAGQLLTTRVISTLESLVAQIAALTPTQSSIDALAASVGISLSALATDAAEVQAQQVAVQAELDKVAPTTPPTTP